MRIYIAGSFTRGDELRFHAEQLTKLGHTVTSRWLNGQHEVETYDYSPGTEAEEFANDDLADILNAGLLLFFSSADHPSKGRGGRHTEFGYALGLRIPIVIIGRRECAFHSLVPAYPTVLDWLAHTNGS